MRTSSFIEGATTIETPSEWPMMPLPRVVPNCTLVLPIDASGVRKGGKAAGSWGVAV